MIKAKNYQERKAELAERIAASDAAFAQRVAEQHERTRAADEAVAERFREVETRIAALRSEADELQRTRPVGPRGLAADLQIQQLRSQRDTLATELHTQREQARRDVAELRDAVRGIESEAKAQRERLESEHAAAEAQHRIDLRKRASKTLLPALRRALKTLSRTDVTALAEAVADVHELGRTQCDIHSPVLTDRIVIGAVHEMMSVPYNPHIDAPGQLLPGPCDRAVGELVSHIMTYHPRELHVAAVRLAYEADDHAARAAKARSS